MTDRPDPGENGQQTGRGEADEWGYASKIDKVQAPPPVDWAHPPASAPRQSWQPAQDRHKDTPKDGGDDEGHKPPLSRGRKLLYVLIGAAIALAISIVVLLYYLHSRHFESTDDAFIDGNVSQISPQVAARIVRIAFVDNQTVEAGQVLVQLDPRDYQVKLDQARAQRAQVAAQADQARAQLALQQATLEQSFANARVSEADLGQARSDLARFQAVDPKAISRQQVDTAAASTKSAAARLDASRQAVQAQRAQIEAQRAAVAAAVSGVAQADVAVANAELQLSYTAIVAPAKGRATKRSVAIGSYVSPGQSMLAVVQDGLWVTANFKETQLADMKPGQEVRIRVDACPQTDLAGSVESFQAGSGTVFSALPAENATGNYVKVVQRLPVRIRFTDKDAEQKCRLAPGLSVSPRVTVR